MANTHACGDFLSGGEAMFRVWPR